MITLTPTAENHFNKYYCNNKNKIFHISLKKSGCSGYEYVLTENDFNNNEQNIIFTKNGIPFSINKEFKQFLNGLIIDIRKDNLSTHLTFINPNEKGACGCGKSISF